MLPRSDALTSLRNEIAGIRRHYTRVVATMIAITLATALVIHFALALQQVSTRMSALGAEEATLLARTEDLLLALQRKAIEPSAGEETLDIIRGELRHAGERLLAIHDEIFALDEATWFGLPIGGGAAAFYRDEPFLIDRRIREKVEEIDQLVRLDRAALAAAYEASFGTGGPLVRKTPVTVGIERALMAFQTRAIEQSVLLGWLQIVLGAAMVGLIVGDAVLVFRPLVLRLKESQERVIEAQTELDRRAHEDALTGLANRTRFSAALAAALAKAGRDGRTVGLFQLDLNGFKAINDTLGHAAGDAVLVAVAQRLAAVVRAEDVVARLGGDEYAIVCPDLDGEAGFRRLAARIHEAVSQPLAYGSESIVPKTSVGCAVFPDHGRDAATLVQHADAAMYVAKRLPDRSHFFEPAMAAEDAILRELELALPAMIGEGGLQVAYRPQFAARDRRLSGLHAVLAWPGHPPGDVSSDLILRAAIRAGLTGRVIRAALERIAADLPLLTDGPLGPHGVSLDLPAHALIGPEAVEALQAAFTARRVAPERLVIVLSEEALHGRGADRIRETVHALAAAGARVALGGFGTTFGSLADLAGLPVSMLRVPASLVDAAADQPRSMAMVKGLVGLAHGLGITVIGTGVASPVAAATLTANGCDVLEGEFLCGPLEATLVSGCSAVTEPSVSDAAITGQLTRRIGV